MPSHRLAFAVLVVACMAAAGVGGYLASRQNTIPAVAQGAVPASIQAEQTPAAVAGRPVDSPVDQGTTRRETAPSAVAPTAQVAKSPVLTPKRSEAAKAAAVRPGARPAGQGSTNTLPSEPAAQAGQGAALPQAPPALPSLPPPPPDTSAPAPRPDERAAQELPKAPDAPQKTFEELVVRADSVIGLQSESTVSSERARVEDRVEARVSRDVRVRDAIAIPAGTRAIGSVVSVERGGKFKERARLGIRFNTLVLGDGTRLQISSDTIYRDGDAPGKESTAKVGGAAAAGAILGAIFGGGKGAAIGGAAGAGAGSATVAAGDRNPAILRAGEPITVRILTPISVTLEQK